MFLDETLHKSTSNDKQVTIDTNPNGYSMVTMNDDITESETDIDDDVEPLMHKSQEPPKHHMIQPTWKTRTYQLLHIRTCCYCDCNLKSKSFKLSKQDLYKARNKLVTMVKLMVDRRVLLATSLYGLLGFTVIIINEVQCFV